MSIKDVGFTTVVPVFFAVANGAGAVLGVQEVIETQDSNLALLTAYHIIATGLMIWCIKEQYKKDCSPTHTF